MDPLRNPEAYDTFKLAGVQSPGLCKISGAGSPRSWDEQKGKGNEGASISFNGLGLAKFKVRVFLWTTKHFDDWINFATILKPPVNGQPAKALDIEHPILAEPHLQIRSVVIEDVSQLDEEGDTGKFYYDIDCKAFRKPKPAQTGVLKGSKAKGESEKEQKQPKPLTARQEQIKQLQNTLQSLKKEDAAL
jgi:hypothetical protein